VSASRGYKSGGFDINGSGTSRGNVASASFRFEPERATSYEAGLKARLFDNNAALNLSVYHLVYDNLQVSQFIGAGFAVGNANAKTDGFDVDYRHALSERFTVGAVVAYNDFQFTSYAGAPCTLRQNAGLDPGCNPTTRTQDLTGKTGELAPKVSGSLSMDWRAPLTDRMDLLVNLSPTFSSAYYTQIGVDPNARQGGYTQLNASAGFSSRSKQWELRVIGRNLTDKAIAANSFNHATFPLTYGKVPTQRRAVAAQLRYEF
jgi:iron complex outermembrane receptor protein